MTWRRILPIVGFAGVAAGLVAVFLRRRAPGPEEIRDDPAKDGIVDLTAAAKEDVAGQTYRGVADVPAP